MRTLSMKTQVVLRYEGLRVPAFAGVTHAEVYATCLEQCAWADARGVDFVSLSEHHGVDDGYVPAPLTLAAAIAGRTKRIGLSLAVVVPLHDPVRLAEQFAVLDLVSGGRAKMIAVPGYRHEEFDMAGIECAQRGRLLEEYVEVMCRAWTGEPFAWRGRTIRVTPKPRVPPKLMVGGATEAGARRAARLRAGFHTGSVANRQIVDAYYAECARRGFDGGSVAGGRAAMSVYVSEDPERDWNRIAPHALYDAQTYASWGNPETAGRAMSLTVEDIRQSGAYRVVTPDECVALAQQTGSIVLQPLLCGMPLDLSWASLELLAAKVLPRLS
jgi:alkanesulfonate monooxygenase SsuD/methylene tetrahydromethanopterin reductase-like flavin-dependent oxidoreductase (luciferase family)